jgi:hypothetical protein
VPCEPDVVPPGMVAGGLPGVLPAGVVAGVAEGFLEDEPPGVFPAGVVAGGPGVWPDGVVAGFPPLSVDDVPSEPVLVPGLVTAAQNVWTDSPCPPFAAAAAASNREKATDDNAFPLVALADICE